MYGDPAGWSDRTGQTYPRYRSAGSYEGAPGGSDVSWDRQRSAGAWDEQRPAAPRADEPQRHRGKRKQMPLWQEMPLLLIVAFCLAVLIRTFLLQAFYIPSGSMEDTLLVGDRVLVNKVVYDTRDPRRGEVVVFRGPDNWAPENGADPDAGFFSKLGRTVGDL